MDRKTRYIAAAVIAIVVVGVGSIAFFSYSSDFHAENRSVPDTNYSMWIYADNCNVSISFRDDEALFYAFDVHLASPDFASNAYTIETKSVTHQVIFRGTSLVESIDLVLGTGIGYDIVVSGENLVTNMTYSNSAVVNGVSVLISQSGSLEFTLDESIAATGNLELETGGSTTTTPDLMILNIDLPSGTNGVLNVNDGSGVSIRDNTGWVRRVPPFDRIEYSTDASNPSPLVSIFSMQDVDSVIAWLAD